MENILNWLDLAWIAVALVAMYRGQRLKAVIFVLSCVLALRLQIELMQAIGFPNGWLGFLDYPLLYRGYIAYGVFTALFLSLMNLSRERDHFIFMAAAITVFTIAFCVSTFVMVL